MSSYETNNENLELYDSKTILSILKGATQMNTDKVLELFTELSANPTADEYTFGVLDGIKDTLTFLGIKIEGVNA
jgi:hypothetical protein